MLTFPVHFTAQVLLKETTLLLFVRVSEAALPPGRKKPDVMAVRMLASAAARTAMRRRHPTRAQSMIIPLPTMLDTAEPEAPLGEVIWDDAGVVVCVMDEIPSQAIA